MDASRDFMLLRPALQHSDPPTHPLPRQCPGGFPGSNPCNRSLLEVKPPGPKLKAAFAPTGCSLASVVPLPIQIHVQTEALHRFGEVPFHPVVHTVVLPDEDLAKPRRRQNAGACGVLRSPWENRSPRPKVALMSKLVWSFGRLAQGLCHPLRLGAREAV